MSGDLRTESYFYHHFQRDAAQPMMAFELPAHQRAANSLEQHQNEDRQADTVVRIAQAPVRAHSEPAQHEHDGGQRNGDDLEPDVDT